MFKTLFRALLALALTAGVAWAANYHIRKDSTDTYWSGPSDEFTVGQQTIAIIADVGVPMTATIPMPFSGTVREVLASRNITGSPGTNITTILQFWRLRAASRGDFALLATWTVGDGALGRTATPSGNNYLHLSTTGPHNYPGYVVRSRQITALNTFSSGDSLAVTTTGGPAGTAVRNTTATIIFIIDRTGA